MSESRSSTKKSIQLNKLVLCATLILASTRPAQAQLLDAAGARIIIEGVVNHPPIFDRSLYRFQVKENQSIGIVIGHVTANDPDQGIYGRVDYALVDDSLTSSSDAKYFDITEHGTILSAVRFDREQSSLLRFAVIAQDQGTPSMSDQAIVEVEILDANDNPPQFILNRYYFQVAPNQPVNSLVGQISAEDIDSGENSRLSFEIQSSSGTALPFCLSNASGNSVQLRTCARIEKQTGQRYFISITASDSGVPSLTDVAEISVDVVND